MSQLLKKFTLDELRTVEQIFRNNKQKILLNSMLKRNTEKVAEKSNEKI